MKNISAYSYFIFEHKLDDMNQGTCFFIKKQNQIYLVTASHNFFVDKTASERTTEEFYVRLKKNNKSEFILIKNNPLPKTQSTRNLDINFYEVNIPSEYDINIVELEFNEINVPENIICYGYAVKEENEDNMQLYIENLDSTEFRDKLINEYQKPIKYFETQEMDFDNYVVKYQVESLGRGTSGAPVFSFIKKLNVINYSFAGLIHQRNELTKIATILRPEKIVELFKEL